MSGKRQKAIDTLKEIFTIKDFVSDYLTLKTSLLLLVSIVNILNSQDMAISTKDFTNIKGVCEFFDQIRKYVPGVSEFLPGEDDESKV